jgi:hypothetical protein
MAGYKSTSHAELKADVVSGFPDLKQPTFSPDRGQTSTGAEVTLLVLSVESIVKLIRPSTLTMPQITPQRDSRALAASSTASGSVFYDTRDPPSDSATAQGRDTGWQTPYTTDYRVRTVDPTVIFAERPARFRYNKERTIERGKSTMSPKIFVAILKTSVTTLRTFLMIPRTSAAIPRISVTMPGTSVMTPRTSAVIPRTFLMIPGTS